MSAPTVWEEGRMSGGRVLRLVAIACAVLAALDVLVTGRLWLIFDVGFVLVCVAAALAVRPGEYFRVAVLPPLALLTVAAVVSLVRRSAVAAVDDGFGQAVVSGLAHHSGALVAATVNTLLVLGIRTRMVQIRADQRLRAGSPYNRRQPNRATSPAPTRVTSGTPEEKSTTVVGSEDASPPSRTASSF